MLRPVFLNRNAVSINDRTWETLSAKVYPNPTNGEIILEGQIREVRLIDLQGRVLIESTFPPYQEYKSLDLGNLPNGLYILHLQNEKAKAIKKVIVQK